MQPKVKNATVTERRTLRRRPHDRAEKGFKARNMLLAGRGILVIIAASFGLENINVTIIFKRSFHTENSAIFHLRS